MRRGLNYTLIRALRRLAGGLRREEVDRLLEQGARVGGKVSNSPPRVQSPSKVSARGTYFTYICIPPPQIRPIAEGRGRVTRAVASLSWRATRKGHTTRCRIFNPFSSFFVRSKRSLKFRNAHLRGICLKFPRQTRQIEFRPNLCNIWESSSDILV